MVSDPRIALERLAEAGVDFIVIGGVAAVLQGAPIATFDLDIVHSRAPKNLERLVGILTELDAFYREHPDWRPQPTPELLAGPGHHLLMTSAGPLDLLGAVTGGRGYEELLPDCQVLGIGVGRSVLVLDLAEIVRLKKEMGREKDKAVLPVLLRTLRERQGE